MSAVIKCGQCGAPLTSEKCQYCAYISSGNFFSLNADGKQHRYNVSYGNESFNLYSDMPFEEFVSQFIGKEFLRIGNHIIRVPMIKFITDYTAVDAVRHR